MEALARLPSAMGASSDRKIRLVSGAELDSVALGIRQCQGSLATAAEEARKQEVRRGEPGGWSPG